MRTDRRDFSCVYIENTDTIYIFGGQNDNWILTDSIDKFNFTSNQWIRLSTKLNDRMAWPFAMNYRQRYVFISGGWLGVGSPSVDYIQIFDTLTEEMVTSTSLSLSRDADGAPMIYDQENEILYSIGGFGTKTSLYWAQLFYDLIEIEWETSNVDAAGLGLLDFEYMPALGIYNNSLFIIGTNTSGGNMSRMTNIIIDISDENYGTVTVNEIRLNDIYNDFVIDIHDDDGENSNWYQTNWDDYGVSINGDIKYMQCFGCFANIENYLFIVAPNAINSDGIMFVFDMENKIPISTQEYSFELPINSTIDCC